MTRPTSVKFTLDIDTMTPAMLDDPAAFMTAVLQDVIDTTDRRVNDTATIFDGQGQRIGDLNFVLRTSNPADYMPNEAADQVFDSEYAEDLGDTMFPLTGADTST